MAYAVAMKNEGSLQAAIDTRRGDILIDGRSLDLHSDEAFEAIGDLWTRLGWVRKYSYGFSWLGRPIIQCPEDMVRIQEAVFEVRPDLIIETGIAHGGSLIYLASLLGMIGKGRVVGVDIDIRQHNREAIEAHPVYQAGRASMIEGSSISSQVIAQVRGMVKPGDRVMVILDSSHSREHVAAELDAYADLVTPGSYVLVQDGIMALVAGMPRAGKDWAENNPLAAIEAFLTEKSEFIAEMPARPFDETLNTGDHSHHPSGWLKRVA